MERTVGFIEATAAEHGVGSAVQGTFGISDGESLWAVRYASEGKPRTLYASADAEAVRRLHPDNPRLQLLREGDRLIVSEPVADLPGIWHEIRPSSAVVVRPGGAFEHHQFRPAVMAT
jgi:glutamine amidotransferase